MMDWGFAVTYAGLAAVPASFQLALAAGAPGGKFTMGGKFDGKLPLPFRGLALVQSALLIGMALSVLDRASIVALGISSLWFWISFGLTVLTLFANAFSPSRPERLLWTPIILAMLICAIMVAWF